MQYIKNFKSGKKISEILHEAADKYLTEGYANYTNIPLNADIPLNAEYTCIAILYAIIGDTKEFNPRFQDWDDWKKYHPQYKQIIKGLYNLGLKTTKGVGTVFYDLYITDRQQARYGWLKMAAMLAEEQEARGEI